MKEGVDITQVWMKRSVSLHEGERYKPLKGRRDYNNNKYIDMCVDSVRLLA